VLTAKDVTAPSLTKGSISSCYASNAAAQAAAIAATSGTDNCSGTITYTAATVGSCSAVVTVTATDLAGNQATTTYNTRVDNELPVITLNAASSLSCNPTEEDIADAFGSVQSVTDNCSEELVASGDLENEVEHADCMYSTTKVWTVVDDCGNQGTASQTVTYKRDKVAPTITSVPANVSVSCTSDVPAANASAVNATDNCKGTLTKTHEGDETINQTATHRYTLIRTYRVTDECGNSATSTQTIVVNDQTAPVITSSPANVTVSCSGAVPAADVSEIVATDNCTGTLNVTSNDEIAGQKCTNQYTLTRTYTVTDASGNTATAVQTITVNDQTAPVFTSVPAAITVNQYNIPAPDAIAATDNCGSVTVSMASDEVITLTAPPCYAVYYQLKRTWTATDACGNRSTATQMILVSDQVKLTCPANKTLSSNGDGINNYNCSTFVTATDNLVPVFNSTCDFSGVSYSLSGATTGTGNGAITGVLLNRGTTTVTYTALNVNNISCSFTVNVVDSEAPRFNTVTDVNTVIYDACVFPAVNSMPQMTANDNCSGALTLTVISDVTADVTGCNTKSANLKYTKLLTRTWRATDAAGNSTTSAQRIYLRDKIAPTPVCKNLSYALGTTNTVVSASAFNNGSSDNCTAAGQLSYAVCNATTNANCTNFASSFAFSRTMIPSASSSAVVNVNLRVMDACGNFGTCVSSVTLTRAGSLEKTTGSSKTVTGNTKVTDAKPAVPSDVVAGHGEMKCFPNPFTEDLNISYNLTKDVDKLVLKLYDSTGRLVSTLDQGASRAGYYTARWNLVDMDPGMYNVCLEINEQCTKMQRVIMLK